MENAINLKKSVWVMFYAGFIQSIKIFKYYLLPVLTVYSLYLLFKGEIASIDIYMFTIMFTLTQIGICLGYHRMESHKPFDPHPVVRFILLALGAISLSGPPSYWVAIHLRHHAHADKDGDPHSPIHGFWHAHYAWINKLNLANLRDPYMKRFQGDTMLEFFDKTNLLWGLLGGVVPGVIDGWHGFLWGFAVRVFCTTHTTWLVNSYGHCFGKRDYLTKDQSRNNFWLAIISMGEGWHNNHHAFPKSAYHGFKWYQIDVCGYLVSMLEKLGLVKNVYRVSKESKKNRKITEEASSIEEIAEVKAKETAEITT